MILKYIIEQFIKTAQPVGSSSLIEQYKLDYSSATVRSEMQELENKGFLEKTHTSSGRVPSAKGYRYYIDHLRDEQLNEESKNKIKVIMKNSPTNHVSEVLKQSCAILSEMTSLTSIMLGPDELEESLNQIQLIPINSNSAVCVFVTGSGHVEHKVFNIPEQLEAGDVSKGVEILNDRLKGTPLFGVIEKMITLKPVLAMYIEQYEVLINAFVELFKNITDEKGSVWGTSNLFDQPEYIGNIDKLKSLVNLVESNNVWKFITSNKKEKINVQIGVNNDLEDVSVVSADVNLKGREGTKIALVGPTRMDYSKVISAMEFLLEQLDIAYGEESEEKE